MAGRGDERMEREQINQNALDAREAISGMLYTLKFEQMAKDILLETETERIKKYIRVVVKNLYRQPDIQKQLSRHFKLLGLY